MASSIEDFNLDDEMGDWIFAIFPHVGDDEGNDASSDFNSSSSSSATSRSRASSTSTTYAATVDRHNNPPGLHTFQDFCPPWPDYAAMMRVLMAVLCERDQRCPGSEGSSYEDPTLQDRQPVDKGPEDWVDAWSSRNRGIHEIVWTESGSPRQRDLDPAHSPLDQPADPVGNGSEDDVKEALVIKAPSHPETVSDNDTPGRSHSSAQIYSPGRLGHTQHIGCFVSLEPLANQDQSNNTSHETSKKRKVSLEEITTPEPRKTQKRKKLAHVETSPSESASPFSPITNRITLPTSVYSPSSHLLLEENHLIGMTNSRTHFEPRRRGSPVHDSSLDAQDYKQDSSHAQKAQVTPRQHLDQSNILPCSGPPPQEGKHKRGKHKTQVSSRAFGNCHIGGSSNTQKSCFPLQVKSRKQLWLKKPRYLLGSSPTRRNFTGCLAQLQQTDKSFLGVTDACCYLQAPHDSKATGQYLSPRTLVVGPNSG
ncbi:hypothetical protein MCOR25_001134 [Pyricularia grisea]|nr:hypothetical protein MCOR25_001134 [Pyricularia grisea]